MTWNLAARARRNGRRASVALSLVLSLTAAGCATSGSHTATPAHTRQSPAPPSRQATGERSTGASTPATDGGAGANAQAEAAAGPFTSPRRALDGGAGAGNGLTVTGVRTARHPGYDRIVFDLDGTGTPGWYATYTDHPRQDGSGEPIRVAGTAFLQLTLHGVGMPFDTGVTPVGDDSTRVPGTGTQGVAEIAPGGVFEGDQLAVIGLTGAERPYRVFTLTDPVRVVVDVRGS